ncbi:hypothetical protein AB205_0058270 [Aquarana catesbeiana]|uniref:Uncharacterized protein n=1 Tax=Aquarana catesbeiana TaxID=8400 RepID=A0A2G9RHM4_AQUCT|nr:hypothetical protein AB205_0058270 [Aquarana catesbeiana]
MSPCSEFHHRALIRHHRYAYRKYSFGDDLIRSLLYPLELELQKTVHTYCGKIYKLFTRQLTNSIDDFYAQRSNAR